MYDAPQTKTEFTVDDLHKSGSDKLKLSDVVFSFTDERGIIKVCNRVFRDVSEFQVSELIGAPHKIVRNPSMPKGVFYLMWDYLKKGETIGAYINNKTKSGSHYWVYSVASPTDTGYLSVRLKPSSEFFPKVAAIYADLRTREVSDDLSPANSAKILEEQIRMLGFESYSDFMHAALVEETLSRDKHLSRPADRQLEALINVRDGVDQIKDDIKIVDEIFKETHQIPFNMRLQAGRLEGAAGPISVISSNHREMTQRLEAAVHQFHGAKGLKSDTIVRAAFYCASGLLQKEVVKAYSEEEDMAGIEERETYLRLLDEKVAKIDLGTVDLLSSIFDRISQFPTICRDVRRLTSGLELTRIMCKIERSKLTSGTEGLDEIINRLTDAQDRLSIALTKIEEASNETTALVSTLSGNTKTQ